MKNKVFAFLLLASCTMLLKPEALQLPSVGDVFAGLTEDQIAEQVKMGQKFLEELEKNGTPEEKAQFEQILLETLQSMSEQDFKDIQDIAKMVEPHLDMVPSPTPASAETTAKQPSTTQKVELAVETDLDKFIQMIHTISQHIDGIFQKFNSSKECTEEVNNRWKSKTTFNVMNRQIHQLSTNRLAQKLSQKNLAPEDEQLVESLKNYLKDVTEQDNALVIEDDFGLPSSFDTEQKHLKKSKTILQMFEQHIDTLMPQLEKYLRKWDPEALEMSKEAEARSSQAVKFAQEQTKRIPSPDLPRTSRAGGHGTSYSGYESNYPTSYDNFNYEYPSFSSAPGGTESGSAQAPKAGQGFSKEVGKPKSKEEKSTADIAAPKAKKPVSNYDDVAATLNDQANLAYDKAHTEQFVDFLNNGIINTYPRLPVNPLSLTESHDWLSKFETTKRSMVENYSQNFNPELSELIDSLQNIYANLKTLSSSELQKLENNKDLTTIENKLTQYKEAFETVPDKLTMFYNQNLSQITDGNDQNLYKQSHTDFIEKLDKEIKQNINQALDLTQRLKRSAKRQASRKKQTESTTVAPSLNQ